MASRGVRFIPSLQINNKWSLIIADYNFWMNNEVDIENSVIECDGIREGMVLEFETEQDRLWFLLKWN